MIKEVSTDFPQLWANGGQALRIARSDREGRESSEVGSEMVIPDVPPLTANQRAQLDLVMSPPHGAFDQRACQVTLASGVVLDRVYIASVGDFIENWGWDAGREYVSIADVTRIAPSPLALAPDIAGKIYAAGESGMGYFIYTLVMRDGSRMPFVTGDAVDFPNWPVGVVPGDVVDVLPGEGRAAFAGRRPGPSESSAPFAWCLYSGDLTAKPSIRDQSRRRRG